MSPIFKSATAKQIAEEVGKHGPPGGTKYRRKSKKRSHTITSGNPAIMEALNNHDAKQVSFQESQVFASHSVKVMMWH